MAVTNEIKIPIEKMSLIFDFDSTLVSDETLVSLIKMNSDEKTVKEVEEITLLGIQGKISMVESYKRRLAKAKPSKKAFEEYISSIKSKITPGMIEIFQRIKEEFPKIKIHIVSQGPFCCIQPVAQILGISDGNIHAVNLNIEEGEKTGCYVSENEEILVYGKTKLVEKLVKEGIILSPLIIVGDGLSDMKIKKESIAKVGICFGLHLKIQEAKEISDYFVEEIQEFETILMKELRNL